MACAIIPSWRTVSTAGAPTNRVSHTAIWTGAEMIIWGGANGAELNDGARYNPSANSWTALPSSGAPSARQLHTAVWTGSEMIVWGGSRLENPLDDGARYNPSLNIWTPISNNVANTPLGRASHSAIWSGTEMII